MQCESKLSIDRIGRRNSPVQEQTVDFGASDGIMDEKQKEEAKGGAVLHIPIVSGAEAIVFNLPGIKQSQLKLTPEVLADIYLKKINNWNDREDQGPQSESQAARFDRSLWCTVRTAQEQLSSSRIILSKVSAEWKDKVGFATSVNWPGDVGGKGNEGVANSVKQIPGAIGYVELAYASQNKMTWAQLQNKAKKYLDPSLEGAAAAADVANLTRQHGSVDYRQPEPERLSDLRLHVAAGVRKSNRPCEGGCGRKSRVVDAS